MAAEDPEEVDSCQLSGLVEEQTMKRMSNCILWNCSCESAQVCEHVLALAEYILYNRKGLRLEDITLHRVRFLVEMSHTLKGMHQKIRTLFKSENGFDVDAWKANIAREFHKEEGTMERHWHTRLISLEIEKFWHKDGDSSQELVIAQAPGNAKWILELDRYAVILGFTKERDLTTKDLFRQVVVSALAFASRIFRWGQEYICCYTVAHAIDCPEQILKGKHICSV